MNIIYLSILCLFTLTACSSSADISMDDIKAMMNDRDMPDSQKLDMIDAYRRSIDKEKLKISTGTKSENGLLSNYILFSQNNVPVILESEIYGGSYNISTTYYLFDEKPYYINGMMRDQFRQSGNFTHHEQVIYLDRRKVIMQLKRSETNTEDIRVDLSHVAFKDITAGLVHPEVDAQENQNTVKKILTLVKEQNQK